MRIVVGGIGFVGVSVGTALAFNSFKPQTVDGAELGVGIGLFVAGMTTIAVIIATDHRQVALAPAVRLEAAHLLGREGQASSESPGLTLTACW